MSDMSVSFLAPTAAYRLMHCLEEKFPEEEALAKASALLYERVYLNLAVPGPLSDFHGVFRGGVTLKAQKKLANVFRPLQDRSFAPKPISIAKAITQGVLDYDFVEQQVTKLDTSYGAGTPFRDPDDFLQGEINSLASIEIMLLYGLTEFDSVDRMHRHKSYVKQAGGDASELSVGIAIPDYHHLSWDDIVEIREDFRWKDFQSLLLSASNPSEISDKINEGWQKIGIQYILDQETALHRVISHIPIGPIPVQPYGAYRDFRAWRKQRDINAEFPFLHVIATASQRASERIAELSSA